MRTAMERWPDHVLYLFDETVPTVRLRGHVTYGGYSFEVKIEGMPGWFLYNGGITMQEARALVRMKRLWSQFRESQAATYRALAV